MAQLSNTRVAVIATDGFEEAELTEPVKALKEAGATVDVVSPKQGEIQAFRHHDKSITVPVDRLLQEVSPNEYDAVVLPGGALNADTIRVDPALQSFLTDFNGAGKPMAVICHAPWETHLGRACIRTHHDQLPHHSGRSAERGRHLGRSGGGRGRQPCHQPTAGRSSCL